MDEIVTKLLECTANPDEYGPSLIITGPGGFGKTTIATALCHHPLVQAKYTEGFIFIELGPHPDDPDSKLNQLYYLLNGRYLKQGDVNHIEIELTLLTSNLCHHVLVVIDDVWHVEDAEPFLRAFRACNIVLTTRRNDVGEHVSTKEEVLVGPMTCAEAISLLIYEVIDKDQLSSKDRALLTETAKDVHFWPLILALVRGQLAHNLKHCSSHHDAIINVKSKLSFKGLTALDHSETNEVRKHAVKVCLGVTLELLEEDLTVKLKQLIFWNGIGNSLQIKLLQILWKVSENKAEDIVKVFWSFRLIQFTEIILHPCKKAMPSVEVHAIISHFIIESLQNYELSNITPLINYNSNIPDKMNTELSNLFYECYKHDDVTTPNFNDQLKYAHFETKNCEMQHCLEQIHMCTIIEPHNIISVLEQVKNLLKILINSTLSNEREFDQLVTECHKITQNSTKWSRKLITKVQQYITQKNYHDLLTFLEDYLQEFPVSSVVTKAISLVQQYLSHYNHLSNDKPLIQLCKSLQVNMPCNHMITCLIIPYLKIAIDKMERISNALQKGYPYTENVHCTILRNHFHKRKRSVCNEYVKKLLEIAPITHEIDHKGTVHNVSLFYKQLTLTITI